MLEGSVVHGQVVSQASRKLKRNFTSSSGVWISQIVYLQIDNAIQLYNYVLKKWCPESGEDAVIRSPNTILHCQVVENPWGIDCRDMLSVWTAVDVSFYGITRLSTGCVLAEVPLLCGDGSLISLYLQSYPRMTLKLSSKPVHVCSYVGSRLLCCFENDDIGMHEILLKKDVSQPPTIIRLIQSCGDAEANLSVQQLREAGTVRMTTHELASQVSDAWAMIRRAVSQMSDTQAGRTIKSVTTAYTRHCGIVITVDDQDCMRLYVPTCVAEGAQFNVQVIRDLRNDSLSLLAKHHCAELARTYDPSLTTRQLGQVIALKAEAARFSETNFHVILYTEHARKIELSLKLASPADCVVTNITSTQLPQSVLIRYANAANTEAILESAVAPLPNLLLTPVSARTPDGTSTQRNQRPSISQSQERHVRGTLYPQIQETYRIDAHPRFRSAEIWIPAGNVAVQFDKRAGKNENGDEGEINVFRLEHTRLQNEACAEFGKERVLTLIDYDKFSYWCPSGLTLRTMVATAHVTPSVTCNFDIFKTVLRNILVRSELEDYPGGTTNMELTPTRSPPCSSRTSLDLASYSSVRLLAVTDDYVWELNASADSAERQLNPREQRFLNTLIDMSILPETYKIKFLEYITPSYRGYPSLNHASTSGELSGLTNILRGVIDVYFDDILEMPFVTALRADKSYAVNSNVMLRMNRALPILRRMRAMLELPAEVSVNALIEANIDCVSFEEQQENLSRAECLRAHDELFSLIQLSELVCSIGHLEFGDAPDSKIDESSFSLEVLSKTSVREIVLANFLINAMVKEAIRHLCASNQRGCRSLTDLLKRSPRFVTTDLVQAHIQRAGNVAVMSRDFKTEPTTDCDSNFGDAKSPSVDDMASIIIASAEVDPMGLGVTRMVRSIIRDRDWYKLVRVELSILYTQNPTDVSKRSPNPILETIDDCIVSEMYSLREDTNPNVLVEIFRAFTSLIESTPPLHVHPCVSESCLYLGWHYLIHPLLRTLRFNALEALLIEHRSEHDFLEYIKRDSAFYMIYTDSELRNSNFVSKELPKLTYTNADFVPRSQLALSILLNDNSAIMAGVHTFALFVETLLKDYEFKNEHVIQLIELKQKVSHVEVEVKKPLSIHWSMKLDRYAFMYRNIIKSLENHLERIYSKPNESTHAQLTKDLPVIFDQDAIFKLYEKEKSAVRCAIVQYIGLALDFRILQQILSLEALYDYKMLLTAYQCKFSYNSDNDIDMLTRITFEEAFLGIVGKLLVEKKADGRDLIDFLLGQSQHPLFEFDLGCVFDRDEVKDLIRRFRAIYDNGTLGPVVNQLTREMIEKFCTGGLDSDVELELTNLLGPADEILSESSGSYMDKQLAQVRLNSHREALKFFLQ